MFFFLIFFFYIYIYIFSKRKSAPNCYTFSGSKFGLFFTLKVIFQFLVVEKLLKKLCKNDNNTILTKSTMIIST